MRLYMVYEVKNSPALFTTFFTLVTISGFEDIECQAFGMYGIKQDHFAVEQTDRDTKQSQLA